MTETHESPLRARLEEIRRLQATLGGPDEAPEAAERIVRLCHDLRNELTGIQLKRDLAQFSARAPGFADSHASLSPAALL